MSASRVASRSPLRVPGVLVAVAALLAGMWAGVARLGWVTPGSRLAWVHGPLMALGFLGTLVSLERAVALERGWAWIAPAASAASALVMITGGPVWVAAVLTTVAGAVLTAVFLSIYRVQPFLHTATLALGAAAWVVAGALWIGGRGVPALVPWLAGFLVLTIVGERLELARLARLTSVGHTLFLVAALLFATGLLWSNHDLEGGVRITGAGILALAIWLARYDIARRTARTGGLPRFTAICLLAGYAWLAAGGALWVAGWAGGLRYDAALHAIFLGFVMSMIFAHAPIILPAVLGIAMPFRRSFYIHAALLHASVATRIGGDFLGSDAVRRWGGLGNVTAILLFLVVMISSLRRARSRERSAHV